MLRPRNQLITIPLIILLLSSGIFAQDKKGGEATLTKCWQFPAENVIGLATNGSDIFAGLQGGHVVALSAAGQKLWDTDLGGEIATISFGKSEVLVFTVQTTLPINGAG